MQGTNSAMSRILGSLTAAPGAVFDFAKDGVGSITETITDTFNASSMSRAMLPPVLGDMAAKFFDRRAAKKKARVADTDEEDDREEFDVDASSDSNAPDVGEDVHDIEVNVEDLAEAIHEGFDDTNENLDRIFDILNDQEEEQEEETKSTFELVGVNGQILSSLDRVEANTRVNELDKKLAHHNQRKVAGQDHREKVSDKIGAKKVGGGVGGQIGGHLLAKFLEGAGETFLGTALASGLGATLIPKAVSKFFGKKEVAEAVTKPATTASKPGLWSKVTGAMGAAKTAAMDTLGAVGATAKDKVVAASKGVSDFAINAKNGVVNAVTGGTKTIAEQAKSYASASKGIASKFLGAPLMIAATGYQAYDVAASDRTDEEKAKEYSKLAGGTGGMLLGAKVGVALGAMTGPLAPIAAPVLGLLGGALGYIGGEKTGEAGHDLYMGDMSSDIKQKLSNVLGGTGADAIPSLDYNKVMNYSPEIRSGEVIANTSKTERLETLTKQIETTNADNQSLTSQTNIVPVQINTPSTAPQQNSQQEQKTFHIPATRNQDGTIQRLLDDNFTPMFR